MMVITTHVVMCTHVCVCNVLSCVCVCVCVFLYVNFVIVICSHCAFVFLLTIIDLCLVYDC